jgi:hypothetical protein
LQYMPWYIVWHAQGLQADSCITAVALSVA